MASDTRAIESIFGPALNGGSDGVAPNAAEAGVVGSSEAKPTVEPEKANTPSMCALADLVVKTMRVNYEARDRNGMDARLRYAVMSQTCSYNDVQKQYLRDVGINERVYSPVTSTKVRAAKSMLMELASYGDDIPFAVHPTPDPDVAEEIGEESFAEVAQQITKVYAKLAESGVQEIPPEIQQSLVTLSAKSADAALAAAAVRKEAFSKKRASDLERKAWDLMVEGGCVDAMMRCLDDVCTYGTCVLKGPFIRNRAYNEAYRDKKNGIRKIRRVIGPAACYESISPVDCYPAPGAEKVSDGSLCVRVRYTRDELWRFMRSSANAKRKKGDEGWRDIAIRKLLDENEYGVQLTEFPADDGMRRSTGNEADESNDCKFEGIDFFGSVDGGLLNDIGITKAMDGSDVSDGEMYYVEATVIGGSVVFCRIYDERIGCPLSKGVFYSVPGSWWGESIADKLVADQTLMNNAIVSLLRNMGSSSSAMLWINDASRLVDKSKDAYTAEPGKVFAFGQSYPGQTAAGAPMGVLQIPSNADQLLAVANFVNKQADIDSGIPAFSEGTGGSNGGALRTAEGLKTYTEAASRGMKMVVTTFDSGIVCETAKRTVYHIMLNDTDTDLRGDIDIRPVGMMGRILKAQNEQARIQLFNLCLNSQMMQQLIGPKGMLALFRPSLKEVNVNPDNVCPSEERVAMLEELEKIKMVFEATVASEGVQQNAAQMNGGEGGGMQSGVQPVAQPGGVSQRRSVA